jgi:hypothetical protein
MSSGLTPNHKICVERAGELLGEGKLLDEGVEVLAYSTTYLYY